MIQSVFLSAAQLHFFVCLSFFKAKHTLSVQETKELQLPFQDLLVVISSHRAESCLSEIPGSRTIQRLYQFES